MRPFFKKIIIAIITLEAKLVLKKYKPKIIVVTGSVGKTSTKDALYTVLASSFYVRKSEKSYNSDIGVPLAVLGCANGWNNLLVWLRTILEGAALILMMNHYPKWLVLEVGADRPDDIKQLLRWIRPDVVVTTRFPDVPVHVEFYASPEAVVAEELLPAHALSENGLLVTNADDPHTATLVPEKGTRISYGFSKSADVTASHEHVLVEEGRPAGMTCKINYKGSSVPIALRGVIGASHIYPTLAACAVGVSQGINLAAAGEALVAHTFPPARMRLIQGKSGSVIIDDTYNSSPVALVAALEALTLLREHSRANTKRIITILGDMLELGGYSIEEHKKVGTHVASVADMLMTVGVRARDIAAAAKEAGMAEERINHFDSAATVAEALTDLPQEGDVILIKGSQSMRMERIVEALMQNPEEAMELLARQDEEWKRR